jgi:hypothetical protein
VLKGEEMADKEFEISEGKLKRLRNLGPYRGKSDEEIIESMKAKAATMKVKQLTESFDDRFKAKFALLSDEFSLDMNNSNDVEMLKSLVQHLIQSEDVHRDIRAVQEKEEKTKDDVGLLKVFGEYQRNLHMSINDLQDKLGISRKQRKEKQVDDIPQFIDGILLKAKDFWERKTESVVCPKDNVELIRYWINFPELTTVTNFTTECPQCGEIVKYNK